MGDGAGGVATLSPTAVGRWLVETTSGSRHLLDLDDWTYSRRSTRSTAAGFDTEAPCPLIEVEQWPSVNSRFRLWLDAGNGFDREQGSSYVTRITPLTDGEGLDVSLPLQTTTEAVAQVPPQNAWLLVGDKASFPDAEELAAQRQSDDALPIWTCPRQIQRGDLVFIYFVAPRKAVHFAARALFPPFYDPGIEVNAVKRVDPHQWWTDLSPLIEVPLVPFSDLREMHGGHLILKGKPTNYLKPSVVNQLLSHFGELGDEQRLVLQSPVGDAELPPYPSRMELEDVRRVSSGLLGLEQQVEQYIVDPLTRMCFPASDGWSVDGQVRITGAGVVDYGVFSDGQLQGVIEVKLGVRRSPDGGLRGSPDLAQAVRYASASGVPAILIDCNEIFLIDRDGQVPSHSFERQHLTTDHLAAITTHFLSPISD